jgi:hypothetical protein
MGAEMSWPWTALWATLLGLLAGVAVGAWLGKRFE